MHLFPTFDRFGAESRRRLCVRRWDDIVVFCGVEIEQGNLEKRSPYLGGLRMVYMGMSAHA